MAKKKNGKRKASAKTLERRKQKKIKELIDNNQPHHNKAYVDPELQKSAGAHGEDKETHQHNRRKDKAKLKKSVQQGSYDK